MMFRFVGLLIALGSFFAGPSHATLLVQRTPGEMAQRADLIVVGEVGDIRPSAGPDGSSGFSFITLRVVETLKGPESAAVTLKVLGGQTDGNPRNVRAAGVPGFLPRERVLVFLSLRPEEDGRFYNVVGWSQGKWGFRDAATLQDGRGLPAVREEIKKALREPRKKGPGRPSGIRSDARDEERSPQKLQGTGKRTRKKAISTGTEAVPGKPPLSPDEREKFDRSKRDGTR